MIEYIKGDIFKGGDDVIIHGANCFCVMGRGFAKQVKEYYPEAYEADLKTKSGDSSKLGTYSSWTGENIFNKDKQITIVNAYTQFNYGTSVRQFDYDAFKRVLLNIYFDFHSKRISTIKIGAGLAGGDWITIEKMINYQYKHDPVKVYIL